MSFLFLLIEKTGFLPELSLFIILLLNDRAASVNSAEKLNQMIFPNEGLCAVDFARIPLAETPRFSHF